MIAREFLAPKTGSASRLFGRAGHACCAVVDPQVALLTLLSGVLAVRAMAQPSPAVVMVPSR
jgi:hypothetical protein